LYFSIGITQHTVQVTKAFLEPYVKPGCH